AKLRRLPIIQNPPVNTPRSSPATPSTRACMSACQLFVFLQSPKGLLQAPCHTSTAGATGLCRVAVPNNSNSIRPLVVEISMIPPSTSKYHAQAPRIGIVRDIGDTRAKPGRYEVLSKPHASPPCQRKMTSRTRGEVQDL